MCSHMKGIDVKGTSLILGNNSVHKVCVIWTFEAKMTHIGECTIAGTERDH